MNLLFDSCGPESRSPDVSEALRQMAGDGEVERGAVFTRPEVVAAILDLSGYTPDRPLHRLRLLEPSFGEGEFLFAAVDRLLAAYSRAVPSIGNARIDLSAAIRAVELHSDSYTRTEKRLQQRLQAAGIGADDAQALCAAWLICDDFLLCGLAADFDVVAGNPPYVRQERIPDALLSEYRGRFRTLYDRADLYVPFFERSLDLLAPGGVLGFICTNRWLKNKYGGPLRRKISEEFQLSYFIDMQGIDAFAAEVITYPAITILCRPNSYGPAAPTRVASAAALRAMDLPGVAAALVAPMPELAWVDEITLDGAGDAPWLLSDVPRLKLLRRLESRFPVLERAGCKVGIGVATGCDRVFIGDYAAMPVEPERKLPLAMARDLVAGRLAWHGKGVLNPYEPDGTLATLADYPLFARYIRSHQEAIAVRHVATRSGEGWYRTIDRIYPELVQKQKLLVPDIKGEAVFVFDRGEYYPHHNLYYITSEQWDLRALQAVLRSSVSLMMVATYCTKMAGGFLRFQAQYLRRICLPNWLDVPLHLRRSLSDLAEERDQERLDAVVFELYGLSAEEAGCARRVASEAQVTGRKKAALR